jgi:hypothetical protein
MTDVINIGTALGPWPRHGHARIVAVRPAALRSHLSPTSTERISATRCAGSIPPEHCSSFPKTFTTRTMTNAATARA